MPAHNIVLLQLRYAAGVLCCCSSGMLLAYCAAAAQVCCWRIALVMLRHAVAMRHARAADETLCRRCWLAGGWSGKHTCPQCRRWVEITSSAQTNNGSSPHTMRARPNRDAQPGTRYINTQQSTGRAVLRPAEELWVVLLPTCQTEINRSRFRHRRPPGRAELRHSRRRWCARVGPSAPRRERRGKTATSGAAPQSMAVLELKSSCGSCARCAPSRSG
jgi:hypothetical protein